MLQAVHEPLLSLIHQIRLRFFLPDHSAFPAAWFIHARLFAGFPALSELLVVTTGRFQYAAHPKAQRLLRLLYRPSRRALRLGTGRGGRHCGPFEIRILAHQSLPEERHQDYNSSRLSSENCIVPNGYPHHPSSGLGPEIMTWQGAGQTATACWARR